MKYNGDKKLQFGIANPKIMIPTFKGHLHKQKSALI
jgi:hypothetical protein